MRISDLIKMGLRNLGRRKARTALTVIGVVIGTISIVVMVSLGIGLNKSYEQSMMQYGSITTLSIYQNGWVEDEEGNYQEQNQGDLMNDKFCETLRQMDHVKYVTPVYDGSITLYGNGWECSRSVRAIDFGVLDAMNPPEITQGSYECVSGTHTMLMGKEGFWNRVRPKTGKEVTSDIDFSKEKFSFIFENIRYMCEEGMSEGMSDGGTESTPKKSKKITIKKEMIPEYGLVEDQNAYDYYYNVTMDVAYFKEVYERQAKMLKPKQRKQALKNIERFSAITVIVDNADHVEEVSDKIREYGAQAEGIGNYLQQVKSEARIIELVLGGIGAVSMLVSAISIANTMIMSIYERTKEIGIMKVLGCVVTDIKKLFLLEAGTIGLIGGGLGLGLSYLISYIINRYAAPAFNQTMGMGMEEGSLQLSVIPIWLSLVALLFAFFVGVISGYLPARRATKISAIEAMKSEG
ncbi:MAG: ABC transporter permease [Clostridium sp.]|nr:ABC transporter permease [Clostridium sp.]